MRSILVLGVLLTLSGCSQAPDPLTNKETPGSDTARQRPNVVVIVVDDIGYTDLGFNGSEIRTPNIDALAREGVYLDTFYAAPTCSPTRSMLLSGVDNHLAGLGTMDGRQTPEQEGVPGYLGMLNHQVAALPELMKAGGYSTYMTGKWHLGKTDDTIPPARGFDRSFSLLDGGAGAFSNMLQLYGPNKASYLDDTDVVESLPDDFYSSRFYTRKMIEYIESDRSSNKPFFAYLSYTSAHWPLQAPAQSISRYAGVYDAGYDALREQRLDRIKQLGLVPENTEPFPRLDDWVSWNDLSADQQAYESKRMSIYAAMIDDLDGYVGEFVDYLKSTGEYENTLIFFMSDNGPEGNEVSYLRARVPGCCDNSYENIGNPDSYIWLGPEWAQAVDPPRRMFKAYVSDGGIRVPAFFHYPKRFASGVRSPAMTHVTDIVPTILEVTGVSAAVDGIFDGRKVEPIQGQSLLPLLTGESDHVHAADKAFGFEMFGRRAIRQGNWKAVYLKSFERRTSVVPDIVKLDQWQLYNLADDPAEAVDLAERYPEKLAALLEEWDKYVETNRVILAEGAESY